MGQTKPPLDDVRWEPVADTPSSAHTLSVTAGEHEQPLFYDQKWQLIDEDGDVHEHVELNVNRRARTVRPPT